MNDRDELDPTETARLRAAIDRLPTAVEPAQDLWPEIRARIEAGRVQALPVRPAERERDAHLDRHARRTTPWYAAPRRLAAAALLLVTLTATATWYATARDSVATVGAPFDSAAVLASLASFASYERSAAELSATLDQRSGALDARTLAVLERSLRTIDGAIAEAREALANDPRNPAVQAFVVAAYRQKVDFLRRANDVATVMGP